MKFKYKLIERDNDFIEFVPINHERNFTVIKQDLCELLSEPQLQRYEFEHQRIFSFDADIFDKIYYKEY